MAVETRERGSILSVMFLVGGTCIGGGMLAMPVLTSNAGFFPSVGYMAVCCAFMAITGLLFVEANLWLERGAHVVTMASRLLGPIGKVLAIFLYLFIAYASLVAYTDGGGVLLGEALTRVFGVEISRSWGCLFTAAIFGIVVYLGHRIVGGINSLLFVAMVVSYILLVVFGLGQVSGINLLRERWGQGLLALPVLLTAFSYQAIVPSLVQYMDRDAKRLRIAIIGGMVIAFVIYFLWQLLILGVVPFAGDHSLSEALATGGAATKVFRYHAHIRWISLTAEFFAFFAMMTSFLGIGMGLFDFLADGIKIKEKRFGKLVLALFVLVPSVFFAITYPGVFLAALDSTGGFGDTILNGMIPVLMVWTGRYYKRFPDEFRVGGGKPLLVGSFLFALFVLGVEVYGRIFPVAVT